VQNETITMKRPDFIVQDVYNESFNFEDVLKEEFFFLSGVKCPFRTTAVQIPA
jgi:hypothetical protein